MNRFILAIAICIPLATVFYVVGTSGQKQQAENAVQSQSKHEGAAESDEAAAELAIEITNDNFDDLVSQSEQPVLLDFWAPWCGPCMMLGPHVESIAKDYEGVLVVGKIDIDVQTELAARYDVESIPLVLVLQDGEVVGQVAGFDTETPGEIRKILDRVIAP